jgi:hypothetical protein
VAVSVLRGYWSAALLGLAAVVLLVLGAPAKAALAGAGFALAGAAVTRAIDLAKERRAEAAQADANRRRDLDETRRVAYMALQANSRAPELVATIVNALAYHGLAVDPEEAARHVQNLVSNMPIDRDRSQRWLQEQIDRITAELGSLADAGHLTRRPLADTRALVSRRACHYVSRSAAPGSCRGRYHTDQQPGAAAQHRQVTSTAPACGWGPAGLPAQCSK